MTRYIRCGRAVLAMVVVAASVLVAAAAGQVSNDSDVIPFMIDISDEALADLQTRLEAARFPDELVDSGWDYGTNLAYLRELVEYWRHEYDWRAHEARLNAFDQYTTNIEGLDIHFIHQRSPHDDALPLLLLNGWPSSIDEYAKVIGPLTDPTRFGGSADQAFHVVLPAMPGYGFSDKPTEPGFDTQRMSEFWVTLMARLGYDRYGTSASDWGSSVARWLARKDADRMIGLHIVGCEGVLASAAPIGRSEEADGFGYVGIQSTKTQTLGYGLHDSPVGLAAWILEKYHGWSDHRGNVEDAYTKDELLTNIMIYWVTGSITSASRLYYENRHGTAFPTDRLEMPTGCAGFVERYDQRARTGPDARTVAEDRYHIVQWSEMPRGGHFPALEAPELWLEDVRALFAQLR